MLYIAYPGTFSPPHFGHLRLLEEAARTLAALGGGAGTVRFYVVCSANPSKDEPMFTPEECVRLWHCYDLPAGVEVVTYAELVGLGLDFKEVLMVRGVRGDDDFEHEKGVMMQNLEQLGISRFLVLVGSQAYRGFSSTRTRQLAAQERWEELCELVARPVAEAMIEKCRSREEPA